MKTKKIFLATLLLLAILTIGVVSASDEADALAADDNEELSVDESPADVIADGESPEVNPDDVDIYDIEEMEYSTDPANDDDNNRINVRVPNDVNGTVVVSSNGVELFNKELKDFEKYYRNDEEGRTEYWVFANTLSNIADVNNNDLITFSFLVNDSPIKFNSFRFIKMSDDTFKLEFPEFNIDINNNYVALDDNNREVTSIWVSDQEVIELNGLFFVEVNGMEYMMKPFNRGGGGEFYQNFVLSSFNITETGLYNVTWRYGSDRAHSSVIGKRTINVAEFKGDYFRFIVDRNEHSVSLFVPADIENAQISMFLKYDWDDEFSDAFMVLGKDDVALGEWNNWTFDELGFIKDQDNIIKILIAGYGEEEIEFEEGAWYDENYNEFIPDGITLLIRDGDIREENYEDTFVDLYIPETTFVYGGTIYITSAGGKTVYSKDFSVNNIDFDDRNRYYVLGIEFGQLNLDDLESGDILTAIFTYENDSKNITKSFFYMHVQNKDDDGNVEDEFDRFSMINFKDANLLRDEVLIEITDFPDGVDDEFEIVVDRWGEESVFKFNISKLTKNEDGLYTFNCTSLKYDVFMDDYDVDWRILFRFYREGSEVDVRFEGNPIVYRNPNMHSGEITLYDEESVIAFSDLDDLRNYFDENVVITVSSTYGNSTLAINLNNMGRFIKYDEDDNERYWIDLKDLGIAENGDYYISMLFTKNGEKFYYNSSISVVDYLINAHSPDQINGALFNIMLEDESTGRIVIYVNETLKYNKTFEETGLSSWNRMLCYNIPLNYLNITESGNYTVKLEVYSNSGDRNVTHNVEIIVGENTFRFRNVIYGYNDDGFVEAYLTKPVPIDTEFVLYLNGKKAGSTVISCDEFRFDIAKTFTDEFNLLKPGHYDARIDLVINGEVTQTFDGSFDVLNKNGTVSFSIPNTALTTNDVYLSLSAPMQNVDDIGPLSLRILIDPFLDEGWLEPGDNTQEYWGEDVEFYLDGATHKINLGRLSAGTHKIFVTYVYDEWERAIDYEFFTGLFTVNVQKAATKLSGSAVSATYNVAKNVAITLKDGNKIISGKKVTVKVGSINKVFTTNKKGQIFVDVSILKPGTYTATIKFAGDSIYKASTLTVKNIKVKKAKPKFVAKKVKVKAKVKTKKVTVTLKHNKKGVKGKITLVIKSKNYKKKLTVKTNKKGVAVFKLKKLTKKGTYTAKLTFKGDKYFTKATGKVKIVVK